MTNLARFRQALEDDKVKVYLVDDTTLHVVHDAKPYRFHGFYPATFAHGLIMASMGVQAQRGNK